jgi:hypothetical protein
MLRGELGKAPQLLQVPKACVPKQTIFGLMMRPTVPFLESAAPLYQAATVAAAGSCPSRTPPAAHALVCLFVQEQVPSRAAFIVSMYREWQSNSHKHAENSCTAVGD